MVVALAIEAGDLVSSMAYYKLGRTHGRCL